MNQERKSYIGTIIIITIIIIIALILSILVMQIISEDSISTSSDNQNQEILNTSNQAVANKIENVEKTNNETQSIVPNINIDYTGAGSETIMLISDKYYYSQLDEIGKTIYDELDKNKDKLKSGNYKFDFSTKFNTVLHTDNGKDQLSLAFQSAWNAFSYDNPGLFYIDVSKMTLLTETVSLGGIVNYYVSIVPEDGSNYLNDEFQTQEQITNAENYIQNIVNQIVEQTKQDSDIEKARRIHNWLISVIEYDDLQTSKSVFNIYGALHNQKAVCEGYARAYKYLLDKVGVACLLLSGTATNSQGKTEDHAWNYVFIDNNWYAVDVTWDDPIIIGNRELSDSEKYKYFLKGSVSFSKNHYEDGKITENGMTFKFPILSYTDLNI